MFKDCLNASTEDVLRVEAGRLFHCLTTDGFRSPSLFQGNSSVAVLLCLCVCGLICSVYFAIICSSSLFLLVPWEG